MKFSTFNEPALKKCDKVLSLIFLLIIFPVKASYVYKPRGRTVRIFIQVYFSFD